MRWISFLLLIVLSLVMGGCFFRLDGSADNGVSLGKKGYYRDPRWSEDGTRVLVLHDDGRYPRLEILDTKGHVLDSLGPSTADSPGWLVGQPAYLDHKPGQQSKVVMVNGQDGVSRLCEVPRAVSASWSRDGQRVAILTIGADDQSSLVLLNTETNTLEPILVSRSPQESRISPSGQFVAYVSSDWKRLYTVDVQTGQTREVWRISDTGQTLSDIVWSPDERYVGVRYGGKTSNSGLYLVDLVKSGKPVLLSRIEMVKPDWSLNGDRIVYATVGRPGANELRVLQLPERWQDSLNSEPRS